MAGRAGGGVGGELANRILTADEAKRAIYFDFECVGRGSYKEPPILLGAAWDFGPRWVPRECTVWVTDRLYWFAGRALIPQAGITRYTKNRSLDDAVQELLMLADSEDRLLVSWSNHDLQLILDYCDERIAEDAPNYHVNAIPTAKAWLEAARHVKLHRGDNSLSYYAPLIGFDVDNEYGENCAASGMYAMKVAIEGHHQRRRTAVAMEAQRLWRISLGHNLQDCRAAAAVSITAADWLDRQRPSLY